MNWKKLTGTDGKAVFVNLNKVVSLTAETEGARRTWVDFVDRGAGISTLVVRETPAEILEGFAVY